MITERALVSRLSQHWDLTGVQVTIHNGGMGSETWFVDLDHRRWVAKAVAPRDGAQFARGLAIAQRLERVSRGVVKVPEGSLYPARHRLENRGVLAADWKKTNTGREAKFYSLTRKGRARLEKETASWERLTTAVALILRLSEGGAK